MSSIGDLLGESEKSKLLKQSLSVGDVFLKRFQGIEHKKLFIIAGISNDSVFLCSVYINSNIHPSIMQKQHLLELQVPLRKVNNSFLKYDSFANCSNHIPMESNSLNEWILDKSCKVIGFIYHEDLEKVISNIVSSGLLTEEEVELYF